MNRFIAFLLLLVPITIPSQLNYDAKETGSASRKMSDKLSDWRAATDFKVAGVCGSTSIQAAITAAGTTGAVYIPPGCSGTYTNPNGIAILDYSAIGLTIFGGSIQGSASNVNNNLLFRNATASSITQFINAAGTARLLEIAESAGGAYLIMANNSSDNLKLDSTGTDAARIYGGGTNNSLIFYPVHSGAGTSGLIKFRDNNTDATEHLTIDTSTHMANFYSRIAALRPAPQSANFPGGNDIWIMPTGSADLHEQNWSYNMTSTTSVGAPGSVTITVGTGTECPSTATADPNCAASRLLFSGTTLPTSNLCKPAGACSLIVDQDTAQEETITNANWSIASATTITATFAKTHTQPYNVRQIGNHFWDTRGIRINVGDVSDRPICLYDRNGNCTLSLTNDTSGTFPKSALQFLAQITGNLGANKDLYYRNNTTASCVKFANAGNSSFLATLCETSGDGLFAASVLTANGKNSLPAATNGNPYIAGGFSSPTTGKIYVGDGTGWQLEFAKRTGSADTTLFTLKDNGRVNVSGGFEGDAGGLKHKRGQAGCSTAAAAGGVCSSTITWTTAFADANYTVTCTGIGVGAGTPVLSAVTSRIAASVAINTMAVTAAVSSFTTIECVAVHD